MKTIIAATILAAAICAHPVIEFQSREHSKKEAIKVEVEARQLAEQKILAHMPKEVSKMAGTQMRKIQVMAE